MKHSEAEKLLVLMQKTPARLRERVLTAAVRALQEPDTCACCGSPEDHYLHKSAADCHGCKAPHDHHDFKSEGGGRSAGHGTF